MKTLRTIPVQVELHEIEDNDGCVIWAVVYSSTVDNEVIAYPAVLKIEGGCSTPQRAMEVAAQRMGAFGF